MATATTSPAADETLALTAGDVPTDIARPRGVANVATALFVAGEFMVLCGLVAAYYALRAESFKWPPVGLGTYLPTMVALTMGMTAVTIQWAVWAIRHNDQRTCLAALGITIFFAFAILNGQWYELAHLDFDVAAHTYGTFVYVLTGFHMANVIAGLLVLGVVLVRAAGGEFSADDHDTLTAAAIFWQFVNVAGLMAFAVLFLHP
ncbi:MAG: heme-copper oxidase subunit III [Acidimicrobiia bacterium]|nr:heme-copper oxidase subunit III [Acidimicrobiia bacterium]